MQLWSERPRSRALEITADIATLLWVTVWVSLGAQLYGFLSQLAAAGRLVREGGVEITDAGDAIGSAIEGVPLVGADAADGVRGALAGAGEPLITFGTDLERLLLVISGLLGLLVVAVAVVPWVSRYLPWRVSRWRRLNAATRVIRRGRANGVDPVPTATLESLLASRAIHRLEYDELLEFTPDPLGDWVAGRHAALARAELDRVGLRAVAAPR